MKRSLRPLLSVFALQFLPACSLIFVEYGDSAPAGVSVDDVSTVAAPDGPQVCVNTSAQPPSPAPRLSADPPSPTISKSAEVDPKGLRRAEALAKADPAPPVPSDLVDILDLDPTFVLDVRYATEDNFLKAKVYSAARVLLRRSVAERLARVQKRLRARGLGLKVFDGYRPLSVQWKMWELLPDAKYVGDPRKGSKHNRGAAVDVSLVDLATKREREMPTAYDDFTERAAADFAGTPGPARTNRMILQGAMTSEGFEVFPSEWWHFNDPEWERYEMLDEPLLGATDKKEN